jgi:hypothetical protein
MPDVAPFLLDPAYWQQLSLFALAIAASPEELARVLGQ